MYRYLKSLLNEVEYIGSVTDIVMLDGYIKIKAKGYNDEDILLTMSITEGKTNDTVRADEQF